MHDLLRQVRRELGDLVGVERLGRGHQLLGVHRRDQRLAYRVGDLEQDFAVALGLDQVPDVQPLVERQRLEDVGDVGRVQPVQLARAAAPGSGGPRALDQLPRAGSGAARSARGRPLDEPMLAQQLRDLGERTLHAASRARAVSASGFDDLGHGTAALQAERAGTGRAHSTRRTFDGGRHRPNGVAASATRRAAVALRRGKHQRGSAHGSSADGIRAGSSPCAREVGEHGLRSKRAGWAPSPRAAPPARPSFAAGTPK